MDLRNQGLMGMLLSGLILLSSLGGILLSSTYSRETASWAAQAIGQDWFNLLIAFPWLVLSSLKTRQGSLRASILLGGGLIYISYSYFLYAFDVHFNSLFLFYCGALGISFYGVLAVLLEGSKANVKSWYCDQLNVKPPGYFQIGMAVLFGLLWLSEVLPALIHGTDPVGLSDVGLMTNPVHVLDLSIVLPALALSGSSLLRKETLGYLLTPLLLGFSALMSLAIGGMIVAMYLDGLPVALGVAGAMSAISAVSLLLLAKMLRLLKVK